MEIELGRLFKALIKKWWVIIISTIILAAGAYVYSTFFAVPVYEAYITMYVQNTDDYEGKISTDALSSAQDLVNTYIVLLKSNSVLSQVVDKVDLGYEPSQIAEMISASAVESTGVFKVAVYNTNPSDAQKIANAIAEIIPEEIVRVINAGNVELIDEAEYPNEPYSPNIMLNSIIGGMIGLFISCIILVLIEIFDTKIRSENDLGQITTLPVVGVIPVISFDTKNRKAGVPNASKK